MCEVSCETWETLGNLPDKQTDQSVETLWTFRYHHSLSLSHICMYFFIHKTVLASSPVLHCRHKERQHHSAENMQWTSKWVHWRERFRNNFRSEKKIPQKTVNHRTYDSQLLTYGITFSDSCLKPSDCHFRWILKYLLNSCIFISW